jgi:beta-N-acetylhexosaminidase
VVELRPRANIAAGEAEHSLGSVLAERLSGTQTVVLDETTTDPGRVLGMRGNRRLVVVVRDAHRHEWMRSVVERLPEGSLVVELGLPLWRPSSARDYVATYGGSRVSYDALADRLLEASEVPA